MSALVFLEPWILDTETFMEFVSRKNETAPQGLFDNKVVLWGGGLSPKDYEGEGGSSFNNSIYKKLKKPQAFTVYQNTNKEKKYPPEKMHQIIKRLQKICTYLRSYQLKTWAKST